MTFIDETAATTKMTRLYGRAPQGERLVDKVPHGHWKTTTFICGLRSNGVTAPFTLDGAMAWKKQSKPAAHAFSTFPPYSPDFNPIEQLFAKLKSFLRKAKARTVEQLWKAIASFLKTVSKGECKAYLANSGYA